MSLRKSWQWTVEMIPMKKLEVDIRLKLCNQRKDKLLKCNSLLVEMVELVNSWIKRERLGSILLGESVEDLLAFVETFAEDCSFEWKIRWWWCLTSDFWERKPNKISLIAYCRVRRPTEITLSLLREKVSQLNLKLSSNESWEIWLKRSPHSSFKSQGKRDKSVQVLELS